MSVGIKDVARVAGVSLGTVSNVINKPEMVSPKTLKKVTKAIRTLGFVPNASARTLRVGKTKVLGLVVPDIANPFFTDLSKGVSDAALKAGYVVILCNTDESAEKEEQYLEVLISQKVRGLLITPARESVSSLNSLAQSGISLGLVDREILGVEACSVAVNDKAGGSMALQHLYDQGHRSILVLTGATNIPQVSARDAGIRQAVANIPKSRRPKVEFVRSQQMSTFGGDLELTNHINENGHKFTAIICGNDLLALGAIRALRAFSLSVPDDISVIGYDDIDFVANANVPLTTIAQPKYQLGFAAAELVIEDCENQSSHVHQRIEFQPTLIVRNSTAAPKLVTRG